ncbi:hypothetical protein [Burkholderia ubonensis]|uniref:hypothetical protein n=1 Tax=Burkholderia ubonensis TaxID=101571 RepID=UPI000A40119F|nr:hypothetical protein [Burkholderia ubonensis]
MSNRNKTATPQAIKDLTTDALKARFQQRSIPLERDFADLIDVAEYGRRAVGTNPEQKPNPASGLELDVGGQLVVKPNTASGIKVDSSGVGVVIDASKAVTVSSAGVGVNVQANQGLAAGSSGLRVVPNAASGIKVDSSGVGVNVQANQGLAASSSGLRVVPNAASGIKVDSSGVGINTSVSNGLTTNGNYLRIAIDSGRSGLTIKSNGLSASDDIYIKMTAQLHNASFYGVSGAVAAFVTNTNPCYVYVYGRGGYQPVHYNGNAAATLGGIAAGYYFYVKSGVSGPYMYYGEAINFMIFYTSPAAGKTLTVQCGRDPRVTSYSNQNLTLYAI